jgi:hypothetical protein
MPRRIPENLFYQLALATASGRKIATWCEERGVNPRTAYAWSQRAVLQRLVAEYVRRAEDRAIGQMARSLGRAVEKIVELIEAGLDDGVQLSAAQTLIDKLVHVQGHAELQAELRRLDGRLSAEEKRDASGPGRPAGASRPA